MQNEIRLLARIVEHTPLVIAVTGIDGAIRYINANGESSLGVRRHELLGTSMEPYIGQMDQGYPWSGMVSVLLNGESIETTAVLTGRGEERICRLSAFSICDEAQRPDALVFMFLDITEDIRKNLQIEKKNLEMARMNSELIRSNTELKKLSELKSNFLSIASHELKTPLTSIKGYSDIIMDSMRGKIDNGVFRMIESINRAADRLNEVVNNILDVTRIEQKRLRLKPEDVELPALMSECIEEVSKAAVNRQISFSSNFGANLPRFRGDRMRMHQVFTNVLNNAVKFSPDKSQVEVEINLQEEDRFHIMFRDQGIGIDKDDQRRVFDPFYEVGSANRHSTHASRFMGGGTGLGLSIARGIIERHGGRIWVESQGKDGSAYPGSIFHVLLPVRARIDVDDDETKAILLSKNEKGSDETEAASVEKKPTLLFIDSDRESVEIACMVLGNAFETIVADSGESGIYLAFESRPSVILLDSALTGLDGHRVCRILRSQEETRSIPIALFSSATEEAEIQKCFASGADDVIVKPFSGKELVQKIWRVLMKKKEDATFR